MGGGSACGAVAVDAVAAGAASAGGSDCSDVGDVVKCCGPPVWICGRVAPLGGRDSVRDHTTRSRSRTLGARWRGGDRTLAVASPAAREVADRDAEAISAEQPVGVGSPFATRAGSLSSESGGPSSEWRPAF